MPKLRWRSLARRSLRESSVGRPLARPSPGAETIGGPLARRSPRTLRYQPMEYRNVIVPRRHDRTAIATPVGLCSQDNVPNGRKHSAGGHLPRAENMWSCVSDANRVPGVTSRCHYYSPMWCVPETTITAGGCIAKRLYEPGTVCSLRQLTACHHSGADSDAHRVQPLLVTNTQKLSSGCAGNFVENSRGFRLTYCFSHLWLDVSRDARHTSRVPSSDFLFLHNFV